MRPPHSLRATLAAAAAGLALTAAAPPADAETVDNPSVALDPAGNAHFAWHQHDGSRWLVRSRVRHAGGALGERDWVSPDVHTTGLATIAAGTAGTGLLAWTSAEAGTNAVRLRRRSADGSMGATQTIAAGDGNQARLLVAPGGAALVAWTRTVDGETVIEGRRRSAGGALGPVTRLSESDPAHDVLEYDIAIDPAGHAVVAWIADAPVRYLRVRRFKADGTLSTIRDVTSPNAAPDNTPRRPVVGVDADGDAIVAFRRRRGTRHLVQARRRSAGGTLSPIQDLSTARSNAYELEPKIAVAPDGGAVVGWLTRTEDGVIEAVRRAPDGTLSPVVEIAPDDGRYVIDFRVGVDAGGDAVFVWQRYGGAGDSYIQARRRSAGGALSPVDDLTPLAEYAAEPELAVEGDGDALITWTVDAAGEVRARRRAEDGTLGATEVIS